MQVSLLLRRAAEAAGAVQTRRWPWLSRPIRALAARRESLAAIQRRIYAGTSPSAYPEAGTSAPGTWFIVITLVF